MYWLLHFLQSVNEAQILNIIFLFALLPAAAAAAKFATDIVHLKGIFASL